MCLKEIVRHLQWFHFNKIQACPDFQVMTIGKITLSEEIIFDFSNFIIILENELELLGIRLDYLFNSQIVNICRKAFRKLIFLKRIVKQLVNIVNRQFIFLLYCQILIIINSHEIICGEKNTKQLKRLSESCHEYHMKYIYI